MKFSQAKDDTFYTLGSHNIDSYIKFSVAVMVDFDLQEKKERAQWVMVNIKGKRIRTCIVATIIGTSSRNYSSTSLLAILDKLKFILNIMQINF